MIRRSSDEDFVAYRNLRISKTLDMIDAILTALTGIPANDAKTPSRNEQLLAITTSAVHLSQQLRVQAACFSVILPNTAADGGETFDGRLMEDISDEDENPEGRKVECVTFPAVVKRGDESGDNFHLENVIVKAKVSNLQ
jgi:activating signal cointegrator complex subunit 1